MPSLNLRLVASCLLMSLLTGGVGFYLLAQEKPTITKNARQAVTSKLW